MIHVIYLVAICVAGAVFFSAGQVSTPDFKVFNEINERQILSYNKLAETLQGVIKACDNEIPR